MTFHRLPFVAGLLCVLLLGFAGASNGQTPLTGVRWDVAQSPTEVINTGRSEVTGSVTLFAHDTGAVTGTSLGGDTQIALVYDQPSMQIDNTFTSGGFGATTGIKLFASARFPTGTAGSTLRILTAENFLLNGRCTGRVVINIPGGITVAANDFIRLEGVRGRIDMSLAQTPGTDLFVSLQSINDPAANQFNPDRVRVAKSFDGMNVKVTPNNLLLCFPTSGLVSGKQDATIRISEGFGRAFVDDDANANERSDDYGAPLGDPTNSTEFTIWLQGIPSSVDTLSWPSTVDANEGTGAQLVLVGTPTFSTSTQQAVAVYSFEAQDQTNASDTRVESFDVMPEVVLEAGATSTGTIGALVTLSPVAETAPTTCVQPGGTKKTDRPRFMQMWESNSDDVIQDDAPAPLFNIIRCNCYMLFTYVTANGAFDTGISIANTTGDVEVFGEDNEAPDQIGPVTFYFYDRNNGFVGSYETTANVGVGRSYVNVLSAILPLVKPSALTTFEGYVIARADFQFCHGFAFIADSRFATVAHGYIANIIPDPAIKFEGPRTAADAGDSTNTPAGEGLNN